MLKNTEFSKLLPLILLVSLFFFFTHVMFPIFLAQEGLNGFEIGILVSIFSVVALLVSFPTGFVNDRWTIKNALRLSFFLCFLFFFFMGLFNNFWILIPVFIVGGLARFISLNSLTTLVYKIKTGKEGEKFGTFRLVDTIGGCIGLFLGGMLIFLFDFSLILKVIGVFFLVLIFMVFGIKPTIKYRVRLFDYEHDFLQRKIIFLSIILFLFSLHWGAEATSYGLFLQKNLGLDIFGVGVYSSVSLFFLGLTAYVFGKRIDIKKASLKHVFLFGLIVSGLFHILMTTPVLPASFIFRCLHEIGDGLIAIALLFWVSKLFIKKRVGGDSAIMFTIMILGQFAGALIFGPIGFLYGYAWPLIISGVIAFICSGLFLVFLHAFKGKY